MSALSSKSHEPSMEEILASIRRIIADDQEGMRAVPDDGYSAPSPLRSVLDLTERQVAPLAFAEEEEDFDDGGDVRSEDEDEIAVDDAAAGEAPIQPMKSKPPEAAPAPERPVPAAATAALVKSQDSAADEPVAARFGTDRFAKGSATVRDNLLSGRADASISGSFVRLGAAVASAPQRSMEDVVTELLRPLLKEWLDENLPPLVERLVQAEIERISRGRG